MPAKCACGATATHAYSAIKVCERHYRTAAATDDSPARIPKNYDWTREMNGRRLKTKSN